MHRRDGRAEQLNARNADSHLPLKTVSASSCLAIVCVKGLTLRYTAMSAMSRKRASAQPGFPATAPLRIDTSNKFSRCLAVSATFLWNGTHRTMFETAS